jgi:hypothetical protein
MTVIGGKMNSCYDWIAFISMAFSAQGLSFPRCPKFEIGEPLILHSTFGVWSITIAPDMLFCELSLSEGKAILNIDLAEPTGAEILKTFDLLINFGKLYDHSSHL